MGIECLKVCFLEMKMPPQRKPQNEASWRKTKNRAIEHLSNNEPSRMQSKVKQKS